MTVTTTLSRRLARYKERLHNQKATADGGFTLVELLITVVIIAILTAIAVPAYISVVTSSQDSAAKQAISSILAAEDLYYSGAGRADGKLGEYSDEAALVASGLIDIATTKQNVSISADKKVVYVAVKADNGTIWWASTLKRDPVKTAPPAVGTVGAAPLTAVTTF
jgi:prepilin-type N-terminal cleavage/methylation domain-containing protein